MEVPDTTDYHLSIAKYAEVLGWDEGGSDTARIYYNVVVTNDGPAAVSEVVISDTIPAGQIYDVGSAQCYNTSTYLPCDYVQEPEEIPGTGTYTPLKAGVMTLAAGEGLRLEFYVLSPAGTYVNTAGVSSQQTPTETASVSVWIDGGDGDGDGEGNFTDPEADGDGILNTVEGGQDIDHDGAPNWLDRDSDGDGILDQMEAGDSDHNGIADFLEPAGGVVLSSGDSDQDSILDASEIYIGLGDIPFCFDTTMDSDGDGIPNCQDNDVDGDGIANYLDPDSDGDGILDVDEANLYRGGFFPGLRVPRWLDPTNGGAFTIEPPGLDQ